MGTKINYAAVGVFVLVLGAVFIAGILWLAVGVGNQKKYALYRTIIHESVAGLNIDAPVKYLGVNVGKVQKIQLDPANPEEVHLLFAIEQGTPIREGTEAVLKTQGLTGIAYVELSGGPQDSQPLAAAAPGEYPMIQSKPSLSARLENVLTSVLAKLNRTSENVDALFDDENRAEVKKILASTSIVMNAIASQHLDIKSIISNGARISEGAALAMPHVDPMLERIDKAAAAVEIMAKATDLASKSAKKAFVEVEHGVHQFTGKTLPETEQLLAELNALLVSLRRLSEQIERNPSSLLRGRQPVLLGPGEKVSP